MTPLLRRQISRVRRYQTCLAAGTGMAWTLTAAVVLMSTVMLADWQLGLSWPVRAAALVVNASLLGWLHYRYVVSPLRNQPDDDDVALFMERSEPALGGRLISTVQLTRSNAAPESPELVQVLVAETETIAGATDFARYVSPTPFVRAFLVFWILYTVAAGVFIWARPASTARAFAASTR